MFELKPILIVVYAEHKQCAMFRSAPAHKSTSRQATKNNCAKRSPTIRIIVLWLQRKQRALEHALCTNALQQVAAAGSTERWSRRRRKLHSCPSIPRSSGAIASQHHCANRRSGSHNAAVPGVLGCAPPSAPLQCERAQLRPHLELKVWPNQDRQLEVLCHQPTLHQRLMYP